MDNDLLQKEEEYYILNKKLELRTKELLGEVENVMKFQQNLLDTKYTPPKTDLNKYSIEDISKLKPVIPPKIKSAPPVRKPSQLELTPQECKELNLPEDACNMGTKGILQLLKATIKRLHAEKDQLTSNYKNKCDQMAIFENDNKKVNDEREKMLQMSIVNKNLISKLEKQAVFLQSKVQSKENENISLKKEVEQLQKEVKSAKSSTSNIEVRFNRAVEECEKVKTALKTAKQEEKDLRENHRKKINELTLAIKKIDKHKLELLNGFKKQLLLIDNLKKQKALIECYKMNQTAENEFKKILDWNIGND